MNCRVVFLALVTASSFCGCQSADTSGGETTSRGEASAGKELTLDQEIEKEWLPGATDAAKFLKVRPEYKKEAELSGKLSGLGAKRVLVPADSEEYVSVLLIELPEDPSARQAVFAEANRAQKEYLGIDKDEEDTGQKYFMLDIENG